MTWVRRLLILINIVFLINTVLVLLIPLGLLSPLVDSLHGDDYLEVEMANRTALYIMQSNVVTMVIMVMSILGVYGSLERNLAALTVFLVCAVTVSVLMLRAGLPAAAARPQLEGLVEEWWRSRLPLDQASNDIKKWVEGLQPSLGCCGIFSYKDWGDNIPASCLCNQVEEGGVEGLCQTVNHRNFLLNLFWQKKSVFTQPCFPFIISSVRINADTALSVHFILFVLMLLASVLSSLMICRIIRASTGPSAPLSVTVMFGDPPPAYHQLYNLPE
ncbi:23 kDa integral membrane protein-like isoform X2 [Trachinotus anak]